MVAMHLDAPGVLCARARHVQSAHSWLPSSSPCPSAPHGFAEHACATSPTGNLPSTPAHPAAWPLAIVAFPSESRGPPLNGAPPRPPAALQHTSSHLHTPPSSSPRTQFVSRAAGGATSPPQPPPPSGRN